MSVFETLESYPEFWVFFLGNFFGTLFSWLVANFQYLIIAKYDLFRQYKLQPNVDPPKWPDLRTQFFLSLRDQIFVLVPMCAVSLFILKPVGFSVAAADIPSLMTFLGHFVIFNVVEDTLFYWIHRMLHIPWLFKRVHYIHHAYYAPYSLVGGIAHPFEFVFNFTLPIIAGPVLCGLYSGVHLVEFWVWLFFREFRSTEAHSGYLLPWHMSHFTKYLGYMGSRMHETHHIRKGIKTNFGSFIWWDWLCGTYATLESVTSSKPANGKVN